jgi:hypothetical protein
MSALYFKYKESGLTVGELRKIAPKPKLSGAPVDLTFVDQFTTGSICLIVPL